MDERKKFYDQVVWWVAIAPISVVMLLGGMLAIARPELFGF